MNDGSFGVYVAVVPAPGAARTPATSPLIHLLVAQKKTLNSGGIAPLAPAARLAVALWSDGSSS